MADCFGLPNAAELVEQLRSASELGDAPAFNEFGVIVSKSTAQQAADTIEALLAENAKLKAERDHWEEIARERGEHYRQMRRERDAAIGMLVSEFGVDLDDHDACKEIREKHLRYVEKMLKEEEE